MKAITLLYHDVVVGQAWHTSGFVSPDANLYKLDTAHFAAHLDAIASAVSQPLVTVAQISPSTRGAVLLAFDDGGSSAFDHIAPMLEQRGWRGHFFISTDWIGKKGFLDAEQIRALHRRGHIIGSHSCSHPFRMSSLPVERIRAEWSGSMRILSEILGDPVYTASVPAGYYSRTVGEEAAAAGATVLFHSEPVRTVGQLSGQHPCALYGRYSIQQHTPAAVAASIAAGEWNHRTQQYMFWQAKKVLKRVGGEAWLQFRTRWFQNRAS